MSIIKHNFISFSITYNDRNLCCAYRIHEKHYNSQLISYLTIQYLKVNVDARAEISSKMLMYPDVVSYMFCLMLGVKLNYNKLCLRKSRFMFPRHRRVMTDVDAVSIPKCKHTTKPMYTRYVQDTVLQTINNCINLNLS